ncbi:two pore channel protein 1-like [Corticium candelabrum]|uniref:two pore channel protein 1-like n=1 Tax=Corticium candelabrum TaxID=121492 RepID=UPI002E26F359|nr:two pore channel protein 1-like [Corticium candelabrum]
MGDSFASKDGQSTTLLDSFQGSVDFDSASGRSTTNESFDQTGADRRYLDACIFLWEGEDNDQFDVHPRTKRSIKAYMLVHNRWMKSTDLMAAVVLLLLAVIEPPSIIINSIDTRNSTRQRDDVKSVLLYVQLTTEVVCLAVISFGIMLRMMWMGMRRYFYRVSLFMTFCVLITMFARTATTPFCAHSWCYYLDLIRAFRPIFLINSYYCASVRRTVRQIIKSLKSAIFIILFIVAFIMVCSLLALILFNDSRNNEFFADYLTSLVSLTVLFTTCNSPDVILPYYSQYWWAPSFFILFLCVGHYMMKALLLAVIFESFSAHVCDKFCRLYLHQREALFHAFYTLCGQSTEQLTKSSSIQMTDRECHNADVDDIRIISTPEVTFQQFRGLMTFYRPNWSLVDVQCFFKCLDSNGKGCVSLTEFLRFYELKDVEWQPDVRHHTHQWKGYVWNGIPALKRISERKYLDTTQLQVLEWTVGGLFRFFINVSLFAFFVVLIYEGASDGNPDEHQTCRALEQRDTVYWIKVFFVILYVIEAVLKLLTLGIKGYFSVSWNVFDFVCVVAGVLDVILDVAVLKGVKACDEDYFGEHVIFKFVFCIRVIRLFRLFEVSRKSQETVSALFAVMHRMMAVALVILLMFYTLSVVGMDFFASKVYRGCCQNYTRQGFDVGVYFLGDRNSTNQYYLNNFDSIFESYVSLFVLMVVNNWYVPMNGFTSATGTQWTRLYFVFVYIVSLVFFDTVVSVIIDSFLFRIRTHQLGIEPKDVDVGVISVNVRDEDKIDGQLPDSETAVYYRGTYHPSKADIRLRRYDNEITPLLLRQDRQLRRHDERPAVTIRHSFGSEEHLIFVKDHFAT